MKIIYKVVAGLDVHKKTVVATRRQITTEGQMEWETKTFGTTTPELLKLHDWLGEWRCQQVAMESTGDYWKPVYNIPQDGRKRRRVVGRVDDVWLVESQFCATQATASAARVDTLPGALGSRAHASGQSGTEAVGRGEHQAVVGGHGHYGGVRAGYVGRNRSGPG